MSFLKNLKCPFPLKNVLVKKRFPNTVMSFLDSIVYRIEAHVKNSPEFNGFRKYIGIYTTIIALLKSITMLCETNNIVWNPTKHRYGSE